MACGDIVSWLRKHLKVECRSCTQGLACAVYTPNEMASQWMEVAEANAQIKIAFSLAEDCDNQEAEQFTTSRCALDM
jgi:hypothetical protein